MNSLKALSILLPSYKVWLSFVKCPASLKWRVFCFQSISCPLSQYLSIVTAFVFCQNICPLLVFCLWFVFVLCQQNFHVSKHICPLSRYLSFVTMSVPSVLIMVNLNCMWTWLSINELFHVYASFFWICRKRDISFLCLLICTLIAC